MRLRFRRAYILLAAVCTFGAAWGWSSRPSHSYETVSVTRGAVEASVAAIGSLKPQRYVDVGAQVSGQIQRLHVQPGDTVTKGQLLVEIDPSVQQATVDAGRAALAGLRAQLAEQRAQHRLAEQQLARQRQMAEQEATRDEDVQAAEASLATATARIDYLKAQIEQTQATLQADVVQLGYTRIYAPMAGTVLAVKAREGQTLNATYQTPDILRIADLSIMTVWAAVSEADIRAVKVGMPAWFVTLGADADDHPRRWTSTVRQLLPAPVSAEDDNDTDAAVSGMQAVAYTVLFDVDNVDGALMPQMTAQVSFTTAQARDVLTAPLSALTAVPDMPSHYSARVMGTNGKLEHRKVRIGVRNRNVAAIVEGLAEGDVLILAEAPRDERRWLQW